MKDFSIITVCFNDCEGLKKTILSVIKQTYTNYEFLVIDGNSNDGTKEIIEKYKDHFVFWVSEPDDGIYNAMNKGVRHSHGRYILFLNAGDVFHSKNVLQEVCIQLEDKDVVAGYALKNGKEILNLHEKNILMMFFHSTFSHQATFIKRELFIDYCYDESLRFVADWKAWVEWIILKQKSYKYIETIVSDYDFNGISSNGDNWQKILEERNLVLTSLFPHDVLLNLGALHEIYMETHYKYICNRNKIKKIGFLLWKILALYSKLISKDPKNE